MLNLIKKLLPTKPYDRVVGTCDMETTIIWKYPDGTTTKEAIARHIQVDEHDLNLKGAIGAQVTLSGIYIYASGAELPFTTTSWVGQK